MPSNIFFEVPVSTCANVTTFVTVTAKSIEEASDTALEHVRAHGGRFVLDDDSIHWNEAYLPDPYGGTEEVADCLLKRGIDESPAGVVIVIADSSGLDQAILLNGKLIQTVDGAEGDSVEALRETAKNLADALGTTCDTIHWVQASDDWTWSDVIRQLTEDAPDTEGHLCEELARFCRQEGLPCISADDLNAMNLTRTQSAWIDRYLIRWKAVVG